MSITELSKIKKKMELTPPFFEETMQKKQGPDTIITETEDMENLTGGISMKIGDFSRSVGVSVDTIRYYISLGLLIPNSCAPWLFWHNNNLKRFHMVCIPCAS